VLGLGFTWSIWEREEPDAIAEMQRRRGQGRGRFASQGLQGRASLGASRSELAREIATEQGCAEIGVGERALAAERARVIVAERGRAEIAVGERALAEAEAW
jgi:hypothetical protein